MDTNDLPEPLPEQSIEQRIEQRVERLPSFAGAEMPFLEQRVVSGMGASLPSEAPFMHAPAAEPRVFAADRPSELAAIIDRQTDMAALQRVDTHTTASGERDAQALSNEGLWQLFDSEDLYDTKRVTLEHFHLFEWFPLSPGIYHSAKAARSRQEAYQELRQNADGRTYYHPRGKAQMVRGGVGAVRLLPVQLGSEPYSFMTASSNGVCHEGFPVLVPRHFYGGIKERINSFGAAPVTLSGEMRYVHDRDEDIERLFEGRRDLPRLYLHVDELRFVERPRDAVDGFIVSVVVSFFGEVDGEQGTYVTFATFDPADDQGVERACDWIETFYVDGLHQGVVVTDFDAVRSRFPDAVFGLSAVTRGELDPKRVQQFLVTAGLAETERAAHVPTVINNFIRVGNITNSTGIAIGPGAQANSSTLPAAN